MFTYILMYVRIYPELFPVVGAKSQKSGRRYEAEDFRNVDRNSEIFRTKPAAATIDIARG